MQVSPPPLFPNSDHTPLRLLVDENLNKESLAALSEKGIHLIALNEVMPKGSCDNAVFQYATENRLSIITMDSDFLSFRKFDIRESYGVIHLPLPAGSPQRRHTISLALNHFAETLASYMIIEKCLVVHYDSDGTYKVNKPDPDEPHRPKTFFAGRYAENASSPSGT